MYKETIRPGGPGHRGKPVIANEVLAPELREQQRAEAKSLLARVIERRPDWSPPYYYQGELFDMEGDPHAALEALQKSVALNPSFAPGYAQIGYSCAF